MLRLGPLEPLTAGDNVTTLADTTDASDPCRAESAGLADYKGPLGCYLNALDPNCFNPNQIAVGLVYATTEECVRNAVNPAAPQDPVPGGEFCRDNGSVNLQSRAPADGDSVKARAGVADIFVTDGGTPVPNFLHLSAVNSFAEVACRPDAAGNLRPVYEVRSQAVYVAGSLGGNFLGLDLIPGLIPNASPTQFNQYGELGPIRFNATYVNNNEPGGIVGPDEGNPRKPDPNTGSLQLDDADLSTAAKEPVTKVVQRAVDIAGAIVVGEAVVDVTASPCKPGETPKKGSIKIIKDTVPNDNTAFQFTANPGNMPATLTDGQSAVYPDLAPGTYTVTETANANYTTTSACVDPTNNSAAGGSTATVNVDGTEQVVCTFTNTKKCTHKCEPDVCKPPKVIKDGKCVDPKPHCDRNGDGKDDRDKNGDGKDDRDGRDLRRASGDKDDCPHHGKKPKKCSKHSKKSKKSSNKGDKDDDHGKGKGDKDDDHGKGKKKGDKDDDHGKCSKKSKKSKKAKRSKKG